MKSKADWLARLRSTGAEDYPGLPLENHFHHLTIAETDSTDALYLRWSPAPERCWDITEALRRDGWQVTACLYQPPGDRFLVGATRPKPKAPLDGQADLERFA